MPSAKPKREGMSKEHLSFIRLLPCAVCRIYGEVEAHHLVLREFRGVGMKAPDMFAIPLCASCHRRLHTRGGKVHTEILRAEGVDDVRLAYELWAAYNSSESSVATINTMRALVMTHQTEDA